MRVNRVAAGLLCLVLGTTLAFAARSRSRPKFLPPPVGPVTPALYKPGVVNLRTPPVVLQFHRSPQSLLKVVAENQKIFQYRGTRIEPNRDARAGELPVQKAISAQLSQLDFAPDARVAHFRWMNDHPVKIIGWSGEIQGTKATPDGIMVRVRVWPDAVPLQGKLMLHSDYFYETYLYTNGGLSLVSWEDPGPHPGFHRM